MGQLIDNSQELITYKRTLTDLAIQNCGTQAIALNIPAFDGNNKYFIPLNIVVKQDSQTIPYDFSPGAHPVIIHSTLEQYVFFSKELINTWAKTFVINLTQQSHNYSGVDYTSEAPFITPTYSPPFDLYFTTANGTNATVGDGVFSIYITGKFIILT
jgi:hypothetical protein